MQQYTRGLAEVGANVFGVGDTPVNALPPHVKQYLADYLQVPRIMDEADVVERVAAWLRGRSVDRILSNWEPLVLLAARLRERFGIPGMSYDQVLGFRDKQLMKERVKAAGLRVPHSFRVRSEKEIRDAAEKLGYPLILKPIAGAGSADTYKVRSKKELEAILPQMRHVQEASCEEFIEGEEFTYDTISVGGVPVYENVAQYLPKPIIARSEQWISPVIITVRDLSAPRFQKGMQLGRGVLKALGMGDGFTHMEWYLTPKGEVVFGEIGCRPGGAHLVDQMNWTSDVDLFREWARVVCWHAFKAKVPRKYNSGIVFKRALGEGRITAITGLRDYMKRYGKWVTGETLLRPGAHRRNWKQTLVSDGYIAVRHPDWDTAYEMSFAAATDVTLYAGG
jgi:biotin carboxylase